MAKYFFKLRKRAILTLLVLIIAIVWGEIFTRILLPQNVDAQMNIFEADDVIGFIHKPHAVTYEKGREYNALYEINTVGLRDREYGPKKEDDFRILLLGDSFAVSHGIELEDSLSRQLEKALQDIADKESISVRIQVINAACGGYSTFNYWKAYHRWAPLLNPDLVLVAFSPDDYDASNAYMKYIIVDGMTLDAFAPEQKHSAHNISRIKKLRKWLSWNSDFYILLRNYLYYNDFAGSIMTWLDSRGKIQNSQLEPFIVPESVSITNAWRESFTYLQYLDNDIRQDGLELIIMTVPLKLEIDDEYREQIPALNKISDSQFDVNQPLNQIKKFSKTNAIPLLDPRDALRNKHKETPCYFIYDGHWVAEGIQTASESAARQWKQLHISPFSCPATTK
jgi:hypothetical protein